MLAHNQLGYLVVVEIRNLFELIEDILVVKTDSLDESVGGGFLCRKCSGTQCRRQLAAAKPLAAVFVEPPQGERELDFAGSPVALIDFYSDGLQGQGESAATLFVKEAVVSTVVRPELEELRNVVQLRIEMVERRRVRL